MKKISIAFVLLLTVAMQIMANHDVVVNHNNRSVTILANFVSPAPIENAMIQAANFWNLSSAKKTCKIPFNGKTENYTIHFRLVVNQNPLTDTALNIITVIPDDHSLIKTKRTFNKNGEEVYSKVVSVNDVKMIAISNSHKTDVNVLAFEMGNMLGLKHPVVQQCCDFSDNFDDIFKLSESVSLLATNDYKANLFTRKFTEISDLTIPYIAKKDI